MNEKPGSSFSLGGLKPRPYTPADQPGLLAFLHRVYAELGRTFVADGKDSDVRDIASIYLTGRACFYVVEAPDGICGCVAVRKFSEDIGELKRLYVAPECRGRGLGRVLCELAIGEARRFGYRALRLDSTKNSRAALALFRKLGFEEIDRYNPAPYADMVFMEKRLGD